MRGRFIFDAGTGAPGERIISSANGGLMRKYYLLVSDFDQTLSFNDSGLVLAEMLGIPDFQERVANLSRLNLVQSGAELTYLLRHDPDFRRVREEDLVEVGRQIRLVFEEQGLLIQEWDRVRTDWLTIREGSALAVDPAA
jgi:hypothetical protein